MTTSHPLHIHSFTDEAHHTLVRNHSNDLLTLSDAYTVHIFSPSETVDDGDEFYLCGDKNELDPCEGNRNLGLNISRIHQHLDTQWLGHTLAYIQSVPSTQNVLKDILRIPWTQEGWVAVTGHQTNGRGRRGTKWTSPGGSIAISMALKVDIAHAERLTFMQYIAALAARDAVQAPEWGGIQVLVKWPNDIYVGHKKVGGVLCEAVLKGNVFEVVVGVGVNVTNEEPTTCLIRNGEADMREVFVGHYLSAFERLYDEFCEQGFSGRIKEKYLKCWMHSDQKVRIGGLEGPTAIVKGLAPNGWVRVFREDLQAFQDLPPENTSLDIEDSVLKDKSSTPVRR